MSYREAEDSGSLLELNRAPELRELGGPGRVELLATEHGLDVDASAIIGWLEMCHDLALPDDRKALVTVLDRIEQVGEVAGCINRAYFGHVIRLCDYVAEQVVDTHSQFENQVK